MRGATFPAQEIPYLRPISIHAPHAGCDLVAGLSVPSARISIHAPHAGCDRFCKPCPASCWYFNPRTPCGVRPLCFNRNWFSLLISIHAPHAGCDTKSNTHAKTFQYFNPRTPCGVRHFSERPKDAKNVFQSTHPMRGATQNNPQVAQMIDISIHAPHAGCDRGSVLSAFIRSISIHAPHAGCDDDGDIPF